MGRALRDRRSSLHGNGRDGTDGTNGGVVASRPLRCPSLGAEGVSKSVKPLLPKSATHDKGDDDDDYDYD